VRVLWIVPLVFTGQASCWDSTLTWQVGGAGVQVSEILSQPLSTAVPPMQFDSRFHVSVPLKLTGQGRCSVVAE